ncbi:MAG: cation transporter [Lachnospiraceae bacterium]
MEQNAAKDSYAKQQKLSFFQMLSELLNLICLVIGAVFSGSVLVALDVLGSLTTLFKMSFVWFLSRKLKNNLQYQFNYGTGKIDALASLCCGVVTLCGLILLTIIAINNLFNIQPFDGAILWILFIKVQNIALDVWVVIKQRKNQINSSKLILSEYIFNVNSLIFDLVVFAILIISYWGRGFWWTNYLAPIFTIIYSVLYFCETISYMRVSIVELIDETCDEETQLNIVRTLTELYEYYDAFNEVKTRRVADKLLVDLYLGFDPETTYAEIENFVEVASQKISEQNPNSIVSVVVRECKYDERVF